MENKYYHYDRERCAFVEVRRSRSQSIVRVAIAAAGVLLLATTLTWTLDRVFQTPQELYLLERTAMLEEQVAYLDSVLVVKATHIAALEETPAEIINTTSQLEQFRVELDQHARILASISDLNLSDRMAVPLLTQSVDQIGRELDRLWNIVLSVLVAFGVMVLGAMVKYYFWERRSPKSALDVDYASRREVPAGSTMVEFRDED